MDTMVRERPRIIARPRRHQALPRDTYPAAHPAEECPRCSSTAMCWIANESCGYNFLCEACGRCWTMGPEGATRVNPMLCPPCDQRAVCIGRLRQEVAACPWLSSAP